MQVDNPIRLAVLESVSHMAGLGWDQPVALFALVERAQLINDNPELASTLGQGFYVPVSQDDMPRDRDLDEILAEIVWPEKVAGCAVSVERIMFPPEVESQLPGDSEELDRFVAEHPERRDVRIVAAADRGGAAHSAARARDGPGAPVMERGG